MSQVLTVPTHFNDLGELSEGFLDRVERDTLILYGPVAYEDGSAIAFSVLLADGSVALEGTGRVRAAVDGGADRVRETRYDVVVEALQFDGRAEVVFERLVLARQAVSDHPAAEGDEPTTGEIGAPPSDDEASNEPLLEAIELNEDDAFSIPPDEIHSVAPEEADPVTVPPDDEAPDTVPPQSIDTQDEYEDDDDPATVVAAVDAQAMMTEAESIPAPESVPVAESEPAAEFEPELEASFESVPVSASASEPASEFEGEDADGAFEHGIAAEPKVGMPVPIPSMAAPPEAPPAPPTLRLAEPPEGLTRPSLAKADESSFSMDGEVSDVHTTGLFAYENGLPIPTQPPFPDLNRRPSVRPVEVAAADDVEASEPPATDDDEYEEVRLSDFAEAAEEG